MQKVVALLDAAIKEEGLARLSLWSNKRYLDLFDYGPEGLGAIKPVEISSFVAVAADASPQNIEQALCAEFEIYQQSGFFKKLWWYFTKPVELYQKVYVLTTLRDLKNDCLSTQTVVANNPFTLFLTLLDCFTKYLKSYLPSFETVNSIIQGQSTPIHQKMCELFMRIKLEMETAYKDYLYALMIQKNGNKHPEEDNALMIDINLWKTALQSHLVKISQDGSLGSDYRNKIRQLKEQLDEMYLVLSSVNQSKHNALINAFPLALNETLDNYQDHYNYPLEFQKMEYGCAVYINEENCQKKLEPNTYTLTHQNNRPWELYYYDEEAQQSFSIPINQVENLIDTCNALPINKEAIEQCIIDYHTTQLKLEKTVTPTQRYYKGETASPEIRVREQVCEYSIQTTAQKLKGPNNDGIQASVDELMRFCAAKHEEKGPYVNAYLEMSERLGQQKDHYESCINVMTISSSNFKKAALHYALTAPGYSNSEALSTYLLNELLPYKFEEEVVSSYSKNNELTLLSKRHLKYYLEQVRADNLNWVKKIVKASQKSSSVLGYFRSSTSPYYEKIKEELRAIPSNPNERRYFESLEEQASDLMGRVISTEVYDTYTCRLAFCEIKTELEHCKASYEPPRRQEPNRVIKPNNTTDSLNEPIILPPMPKEESELAWECWLVEIKKNPNTLNEAIKALLELTKIQALDWQTDLQRYKILVDLVVLKIEAIVWNVLISDTGWESNTAEVIDCLRKVNIIFAKRYHTDKNRNLDDEAMKSFNACRDEGIDRIESVIESKIKPSWIMTWIEKNQDLYLTNYNKINNYRINDLNEGIANLNEGISNLREGIANLKEGIANLREEVENFIKEKEIHTKEIDDLKSTLEHIKRKKAEKEKVNHGRATSTSCMGLFAANIKPQPRYPANTLASNYQELLQANGWKITQLSDEGCNFFTAIISEIKRLKKSLELETLDESDVRRVCYQSYKKTLNWKKRFNALNAAFRELNSPNFQAEREESYPLIIHSSKNDSPEGVVIEGECAVEGVILCIEYRLPAIGEITIGPNNGICYAYATNQKYSVCSEEKFTEHTKDSPVLLRCDGNYYFASKLKTHTLELQETRSVETFVEPEDYSVRTQKSAKQTKTNDDKEIESSPFMFSK